MPFVTSDEKPESAVSLELQVAPLFVDNSMNAYAEKVR